MGIWGGITKPLTSFHEEMIRFAHNHPDQYNQFVSVINAYCGWGGMGCAAMNADFYASIYTTNITQVVSAAGKAARRAAFTAAAFFIAGEVTQMSEGASQSSASTVNSAAWWTKVGTHALVGCLSARVNDGSCHKGATSAGVTAGATGPITEYFQGDYVAQASALAVLGGVTSVIAGGKFTNGATMALYGYLWNCGMHGCASDMNSPESASQSILEGRKWEQLTTTEKAATVAVAMAIAVQAGVEVTAVWIESQMALPLAARSEFFESLFGGRGVLNKGEHIRIGVSRGEKNAETFRVAGDAIDKVPKTLRDLMSPQSTKHLSNIELINSGRKFGQR